MSGINFNYTEGMIYSRLLLFYCYQRLPFLCLSGYLMYLVSHFKGSCDYVSKMLII